MEKITFYPLGNADSCLIQLANKTVLIDFADMRDAKSKEDKRCPLSTWLREDLGKAKAIDVVVFTHLDNDHVKGASEFFYLDHAKKYQGDDRIVIREMWVPAAAIVEADAENDGRVIREEAKHRLRIGKGIKVFSRPAHLKDWFEKNGIKPEDRVNCIVDAGQTVPGFSVNADGAEFFVHAPFAERDGEILLDRNDNSIVLHATFRNNTTALFTADITQEPLDKIIEITEKHDRKYRLQWDLMKCAHHCSYLSLNAEEKGKEKTTPSKPIARLISDYAKANCKLVITSDPISNSDQDQPPHFQARKCYSEYINKKSGSILVTMETPSTESPERIVFNITSAGFARFAASIFNVGTAYSSTTPRMGSR